MNVARVKNEKSEIQKNQESSVWERLAANVYTNDALGDAPLPVPVYTKEHFRIF